jgi:hypothetical protein
LGKIEVATEVLKIGVVDLPKGEGTWRKELLLISAQGGTDSVINCPQLKWNNGIEVCWIRNTELGKDRIWIELGRFQHLSSVPREDGIFKSYETR